MKKHLFNKGLLTAFAIIATLTCQSCQQKSTTPAQPKEPSSQPSPSSQFNCDESEEGCNVEESGEEAMIHVIEIDQPETTNVSEENSSKPLILEAATEVSATPTEATSTTVETSASVLPAADPTATIAVQEVEAPTQEQKQEPKKDQDQ